MGLCRFGAGSPGLQGPRNRDKWDRRRGEGGRGGACPVFPTRVPGPGGGAPRAEGSAAALEPGYRARQAARGRAGYGAGGLRGRRWSRGPVHGCLSAESPSGAVRLVAAGRVGPPCPEREAGRAQGAGKVPSPSCLPFSGRSLAAGPLTAAWPPPHPGPPAPSFCPATPPKPACLPNPTS